ncbi:tripartite tricarboxylate transporter substrate binding protein [Hydrogenophaga sp.]|uniref:Bug family tripartite tricarboxylate transporter substrate binding protein n=1 Tax=Hydrogenophaga sp. TaxID=1904254 RepID=UPI00272393B1|nr:tripartite tricarboxylate transporter substrate binding protein [Hydrogenophaga sp.]MDO9435901.1 tripartite tricarboxylate transporter substrate binding protein [Hydrogenophaga sp.]
MQVLCKRDDDMVARNIAPLARAHAPLFNVPISEYLMTAQSLVSPSRRELCIHLLAASALACAPALALAQADYPNRVIRIVVPNAAGTTSDTFARTIGDELSKRWKVPVIIDNRAGAEGRIAARYFITTPPDGYTLFLGTTSTHAINPVMVRNNGYDPIKDMKTIALMTHNTMALCVPVSSPIKSVADLVAASRAAPGKLNLAGGSSFAAIGTQAFMSQAQMQATYVPYKSTAAALQDLIGAHADAMFVDLGNGMSQIRAGTIRALATTAAHRQKSLPDVPSMEESGFPGFQMTSWSILSAPAGLPPAVADKLNAEVRLILAVPDVVRLFTGNGSEIVSSPRVEADDFVKAETKRWSDMMVRSGIKPE